MHSKTPSFGSEFALMRNEHQRMRRLFFLFFSFLFFLSLSLSFFTRVRIKLAFFRKRVWFSLLFASMGSLLPLAQNADALDDFSLLCLLLCLLFSARGNEIGRRYERLLREGRLVAEV
jgi:hypothetical protein